MRFLLLTFGGWVNRRQQVIEYLVEENRVPGRGPGLGALDLPRADRLQEEQAWAGPRYRTSADCA